MTNAVERKPIDEMTVAELRAELKEADVEIPGGAKKADLQNLVGEARAESAEQAEPEAAEEDAAEEPGTELVVAEPQDVENEIATALALREKSPVPTHALPSSDEYAVLSTLAHRTYQTTFVPAAYRGREPDVFAAFLFGREIGLGPMMALRDIHMIDGRPALAAHRQLAKLREGGVVLLESEATRERAFIRAKRLDTGEVMAIEFTYEEAELVDGGKLVDKKNWRSWRADMLWARAVGRLTRRLGPDLLGGLPPYVAEEVADFSGYAVEYDAEGTPVFREGGNTDVRRDTQPSIPKTWAEVAAIAEEYGVELGWGEWVRDAAERLFKERELANLSVEQKRGLHLKAAGAIVALREAHDPGSFPPPTREVVQKAWASVLDGDVLPGPAWRFSPAEAELGVPTFAEFHGVPEPEVASAEPEAEPTTEADDADAGERDPADGPEEDGPEWPDADDPGYGYGG